MAVDGILRTRLRTGARRRAARELPSERTGHAYLGVDDESAASSSQLLAGVEEAFGGAREEEDLTKALDNIQTFLIVRRVRLLEDLLLLSASLGSYGAGEPQPSSAPVSTTTTDSGDGDDSGDVSAAALRRQLASANEELRSLPPLPIAGVDVSRAPAPPEASASNGVGGSGEGSSSGVSSGQEISRIKPSPPERVIFAMERGRGRGRAGGVEKELGQAAGVSTKAFFCAWAERFGALVVPLGADGGQGVGAQEVEGRRKDDREIQAARDIERDTLLVNGVLVVGSEGYSAVVRRVKRELGLLAEPVVGADRRPPPFPAAVRVADGTDTRNSGASDTREPPLRPHLQLENFSKLVLKAANRTESGGLSFDAIHRIMSLCPGGDDGSILVVPDSSKAEPLAVNVSAGGFTERGETAFESPEALGVRELREGVHAFGICAHVEAVTVYSLYSADMEQVYLRLRATFRNSLRLSLSPVSNANCETFGDVGYRGEYGEVELEVLEGPHNIGH